MIPGMFRPEPVESSFVPPGATGPRIEIRRQLALRPVVTVDGRSLRAKWNLRASGLFAYLALLVAFIAFTGSSSITTLGLLVPIAVAFFLVELPWAGTYEIPMADGTRRTLRLKGARQGMRAVIDGTEIPVERQLSSAGFVLSYLPTIALFAAIFIRFVPFAGPNVLGPFGPILTGVLGFLAVAGGQALIRGPVRQGTQLIGIVALTVVVGGLELAMHLGAPDIPVGEVGACLDVGPGGTFSTSTVLVDCRDSHTSEVIGTSVFEANTYPGSSLAFLASDRCASLFVDYVGSDPERSILQIGYFAPTADMWGLGARTVTCITYRRDGTPLTDTVRGSRL